MAQEDIAERIRKAMQAAGLRQAALARRLRVSEPTVHGWLNRLHGITWINVRKVAAVLGVSPGWIMFGADEEAERVAQTAEELGFLRMFRDLDDEGQAAVLRLLAAMRRPPHGSPVASEDPPGSPHSRRPFGRGSAAPATTKGGGGKKAANGLH